MAYRYRCPHGVSGSCDWGNGKAPRRRCRACKGELIMERGQWGVFRWRLDGNYKREDAIAIYETKAGADNYVRVWTGLGTNIIARFIPWRS